MNRRRWLQLAAGAAVYPAAHMAGSSAPKPDRPTPEQLAWQDMELSMFVHFGPATWQNREDDDLSIPPGQINPAKLDTEQWADVAQSLGARQIVFVAKHVGGFCWWQTGTTQYSVRQTPWRGGKGDVMHDLAESCRKRNMRLGVYLSPKDHALGAGLGGKCGDPAAQKTYDALYRQQLTELLSRYGDISEIWFDGSSVIDVGDIVHQYAPAAMIFQSPQATIRWVGNEDGIAPDPNWNLVPEAAARSGTSTAKDGGVDGKIWLPCEVDARLHDTWFWNASSDEHVKSVDQLMAVYYRSVGHGAVLLLNNTPDTTGLIPDLHAKRTAEFGAEIRRRFAKPVAQAHGSSETLEIKLPRPVRVDHAVIMEDISKGQHVESYALFGLNGDNWHELTRGTTIGHKKIDAFPPAEVSELILRLPHVNGDANIRSIALYEAGPGPRYQVIYDWKPASFDSGRTTWDIDLRRFVKQKGECEVTFVVTGGAIIVQSVTIIAGGSAHDEYVSRVRNRVFRLTLPEIGDTLDLRAVVSTDPAEPAYGQIALTG